MAKRKTSRIAPAAFPDDTVERELSALLRAAGYPKFRIDGFKKTIRDALAANPAYLADIWRELKRLAAEVGALPEPDYNRLIEIHKLGVLVRLGGDDAGLAAFVKETRDGPVRARICGTLAGDKELHLPPVGAAEVFALLDSSRDTEVLESVFLAEFQLSPDAARKRWRRVLEARAPAHHIAPVIYVATYVEPKTIAKLCADLGHYHAETDKTILDAFMRATDKSNKAFLSFLRWATTQPLTTALVDRATILLLAYEGRYSVAQVTKPMQALAAAAAARKDTKSVAKLAKAFKRFGIPTAPRALGSRRA